MRQILYSLILTFLFINPLYAATELKDEGTSKGYINRLNFIGSGVSAARDGIQGNITVSGGGTTDDDVTVNSTEIDTTANFLDGTDITWTLTDGGAGGPDDVTGTVVNDSHAHTSTTISGLDISADTNLTAGDHITLTDDDLDVDDDFILNTGDTGTGNYGFGGNVGVGTTAPITLLDVNSLFNVLASGNVGIGTTGPSEHLEIQGTGTQILGTRTSSETTAFYTVAKYSHKTDGDMADGFGSNFQFAIEDATSGIQRIARVGGVRDGADNEGALVFEAGTNGLEEFMRITNDGNVGIGTTGPLALFHNAGTTAFTPSATTNIAAATGITVTKTIMRVAGDGGTITVTANPAIADGNDGQIVIIYGESDSNTVTLTDGNGLQLASGVSFTLGLGDVISFTYFSGVDLWRENFRGNN